VNDSFLSMHRNGINFLSRNCTVAPENQLRCRYDLSMNPSSMTVP
jgi:hypothetical protein